MLNSERTILDLELLSHTPTSQFNIGASAVVRTNMPEALADRDYQVRYTLKPEELGTWACID